ncbi:MAG: glucose-6-phosphate isomerase [Thermodesulfobacteriota bacterium]
MPAPKPTDLPQWRQLQRAAEQMNRPEKHLRHLLENPDRIRRFAKTGGGLLYDFSRQRMDDECLALLLDLARSRDAQGLFSGMISGKKSNASENRAALHTATRCFSDEPLVVDGHNVMPDILKVKEDIRRFSIEVHNGRIHGADGKPFTDIVVIGIGGSYLGTEFVAAALKFYADKGLGLHFLSNVDIHNFGEIVSAIQPETTLWIIISKSYTTVETMANANLAYAFMKQRGIDPEKHVVTVTSKGSPGDDPSNPVLASFHMFDFIGGRYSVTSAVGGVPLSLYLGYERFERFLKGAGEMDRHAAEAPPEENLPLIAALIGIWNNNFLGYPAQGIIPYASPLSKLAPHIQQLYMESNGKSVTTDGDKTGHETGVIIFGEPGTNAQHSFFQLAHQGRTFPIDFIGVLTPLYDAYPSRYKGVTNHQELWANLISQPTALALGKEDGNPFRCFSGNRPSSTILLTDLTPENIGRLLSFYEARTVFEAFLWNINPFDQFGVELGKTLADGIREEMKRRNHDPDHRFSGRDPISAFYLNSLFNGRIHLDSQK